jgi:hypothetical protein
MKTYKWFIIIALVLALSMPATPVSAQVPSASNTLTSPSPNPGRVGSEVSFALVLTVENINPGVTAAEIYLAYDDTLVTPLTSPSGAVEPLPDFFGVSIVSINENLPGCPGFVTIPEISLSCIHLIVAGPAQVTHSGAVARFHFRGIAPGDVCFEVLKSTLVDKDGFLVNHTRGDSQCVTIDSGGPHVTGTVLRQGTPANPNPGGGTLACSEVNGFFTNESGDFKLTNVPNGTYRLRAEYPGYLASQKTITVPSGSTTIDAGTTELCGGDVNNDDKINILDIGTIIIKFGTTGVEVRSDLSNPPVFPADCTDPDEPADINDDAMVNISDLAIAAGNWGRNSPQPWMTRKCDP